MNSVGMCLPAQRSPVLAAATVPPRRLVRAAAEPEKDKAETMAVGTAQWGVVGVGTLSANTHTTRLLHDAPCATRRPRHLTWRRSRRCLSAVRSRCYYYRRRPLGPARRARPPARTHDANVLELETMSRSN
jgi:hypothetical protein